MTQRAWPLPRARRTESRSFRRRFDRSTRHYLKALAAGHGSAAAAAKAGVSLWTIRRWLALGHPDVARAGVDDHFVVFRAKWLKASR